MAKVTNTGSQPFVLVNGTFLAPGVETDVQGWADVKKHPMTKALLDNGTLSLDGPDEDDDTPSADDLKAAAKVAESQRKDTLIALLKELGSVADKRTSLDKLEAQLVEAQQRKSLEDEATAAGVEFTADTSSEDLTTAVNKAKFGA